MSEIPTIRVLLVDAQAVVRGGLRYLLQNVNDIVVVGEAESGSEALAMVAALTPDLVIMDMMMPDLDGIAVIQQIRQRFQDVRVLALTTFAEGDFVQRALQAGVIGFLLKDIQGSELTSAIRAAYAGLPVLALDVAKALMTTVDQRPKPGVNLSARELEVLRLMVAGQSNEQIAGQLEISRNTVRHHVHNILGKLDAVNRTEAVALAVQHGLVLHP